MKKASCFFLIYTLVACGGSGLCKEPRVAQGVTDSKTLETLLQMHQQMMKEQECTCVEKKFIGGGGSTATTKIKMWQSKLKNIFRTDSDYSFLGVTNLVLITYGDANRKECYYQLRDVRAKVPAEECDTLIAAFLREPIRTFDPNETSYFQTESINGKSVLVFYVHREKPPFWKRLSVDPESGFLYKTEAYGEKVATVSECFDVKINHNIRLDILRPDFPTNDLPTMTSDELLDVFRKKR